MLIVPPRHYCIIGNPAVRIPHSEEELANRKKKEDKSEVEGEGETPHPDEEDPLWDERGKVVTDDKGQVRLKHGDRYSFLKS